MVIQSYRRVLKIERRIYRIREWAPVPRGVPLYALGYFAAAWLAVLILGKMWTTFGLPLPSVPVRFVVIPFFVALLGTRHAPDGRRAHIFLLDLLAFLRRPRRTSAGESLPPTESQRLGRRVLVRYEDTR